MTRTWSKTYPTEAAAEAAVLNHAWICDVGQMTVPALLHRDQRTLVFEHVSGGHVAPADLGTVAATMGCFHAAVHQSLGGVGANEAHHAANGTTILGFVEHREVRLLALLDLPSTPATPLTPDLVRTWIACAKDLPAAVYKDANVRNFLLTPEVTAVDFDALTLAPFGYDLAKLIVSAQMTYGSLTRELVADTLHAYNECLIRAGLPSCTEQEFAVWMEMHAVLTSPYSGRNGYLFPWCSTLTPGVCL